MTQTEQPNTDADDFMMAGTRNPDDEDSVRLWVRTHDDGSVEMPDDLTLDEARRCIDYLARYVRGVSEAMQKIYRAFIDVQDALQKSPPTEARGEDEGDATR